MPKNDQIKSRERVIQHGEVLTNEREVNAMLDLVKDEADRIDSRFLEPACGTGNFVIEILNRKLATVYKKYHRSRVDYEKFSVVAVSSIYGVDILEDNVEECRKRVYERWNETYSNVCKSEADDECRKAVRYIIAHNILCGDALTMLQADSSPIVFSQWDLVSGNRMKRRDYRLDQLMKTKEAQMDLEMFMGGWEYDEETEAWIPSPIKEYPLMPYREVQYAN